MKKLFLLAVAAAACAVAACDAPTDIAGARSPRPSWGSVAVDLVAPDTVREPGQVIARARLLVGTGSWRYTWSFRRCRLADRYACSRGWNQIADGIDVKGVSRQVYADDWQVDFLVEVKDTLGNVVSFDIHEIQGPRNFIPPLAVSISGADTVTTAGEHTYQAAATGGDGTYTYAWEQSVNGGAWEPVGSGAASVTLCIRSLGSTSLSSAGTESFAEGQASRNVQTGGSYPIDLRVTVGSVGLTKVATRTITARLTSLLAVCRTGVDALAR